MSAVHSHLAVVVSGPFFAFMYEWSVEVKHLAFALPFGLDFKVLLDFVDACTSREEDGGGGRNVSDGVIKRDE